MGPQGEDSLKTPRLVPGPAAAAIILTDDGRYLLQLRDDIPGIWYPGHWGLFGGGIDPGESPEQALRREVQEEIGLRVGQLSYFSRFDFDFSFAGGTLFPRYFYEITIAEADIDTLALNEGADFDLMDSEQIFDLKLVPYDAFALLMHVQFGTTGSVGRSKPLPSAERLPS